MSRKTCTIQFEVLFPQETMAKLVNPVADLSTVENGVLPEASFKDSAIRRIWEADQETAKKYIYIDGSVLANNYPGIRDKKGKLLHPFDKLPAFGDIGQSTWMSAKRMIDVAGPKEMFQERKPVNGEATLHKNGGWIINEGMRYASKTTGEVSGKFVQCTAAAGTKVMESKKNACHAISGLGSLQNGKGYHVRVSGAPTSSKNPGVATFSIDVDGIKKRASLLSGNALPYSIYAIMMPRVTYWIRTVMEDKKANAVRELDSELKAISETGAGKFIKTSGDLDRWMSNILANGTGTEKVKSTAPFDPAGGILDDKDAAFLKDDFVSGTFFASKCSSVGVPVLVDHGGNFVPYSGKRKRPTVAEVTGNATASELKKWEWQCPAVDGPITGTAITPRTIVHRRSVDTAIEGGKATIRRSDMNEEMKDVLITSWNAMGVLMREGKKTWARQLASFNMVNSKFNLSSLAAFAVLHAAYEKGAKFSVINFSGDYLATDWMRPTRESIDDAERAILQHIGGGTVIPMSKIKKMLEGKKHAYVIMFTDSELYNWNDFFKDIHHFHDNDNDFAMIITSERSEKKKSKRWLDLVKKLDECDVKVYKVNTPDDLFSVTLKEVKRTYG